MKLKATNLLLAATVGIAASVIADSANAISLTTTSGPFSAESGVSTVLFDDGFPDANPLDPYVSGIATYSGTGAIVKGTVSGRYLAPGTNSGNADGTPYLTFGSPQEPGAVTVNFAQALNYFGLYVGSVDRYNFVNFFRGSKSVGSFSGVDIFRKVRGTDPRSSLQNFNFDTYVNFFADAGESFDRIVLSSGQAAFESDNHAYRVVPTPALLPGLIGMGLAALRKRKGEGAEQPDEVKA